MTRDVWIFGASTIGGVITGGLLFLLLGARPHAPTVAAPLTRSEDPWVALSTRERATSGTPPSTELIATSAQPQKSATPQPIANTPPPRALDAQAFAEWLIAANAGDAAAARWISDSLQACAYVPNTVEGMESRAKFSAKLQIAQVEAIHDSARKENVKLPDIPMPSEGELSNDAMSAQIALARRCAHVSEQTGDSALIWLERAAEHGDPEARLRYGMEAIRANAMPSQSDELIRIKQATLGHLRERLAAHDARALLVIGEIFEYGVFEEPATSTAYAYYHAYTRAGLADDAMPWIAASNMFRANANQMARARMMRLAREMTPEQIAAARTLGDRLFAGCCG